ncbi:MAG: hypothetical protein ABSC55_02810, partial [Syntrophorhabdales bacterium]
MKIVMSPKCRFWFGLFLLGLIYAVIAYAKTKDVLAGDEGGYLRIANDLAKGKLPQVNWWGPGYPLFLAPFVKLQVPLGYAKLANAGFLIGATIYLRSSLLLYMTEQHARRIALLMGLYLPLFFYLHMIISEKFAIFLMSAFCYHYLAMHEEGKGKSLHLIGASMSLAWLALTKVFFGYVLMTLIFLALVGIWKWRLRLMKTLLVLLISMLFCLPYVWHNYKLTGKMFYWATSGGLSLYWMSTPFPGETGTWFGNDELYKDKLPVHKDHYKLFEDVSSHSPVKRDDELKRAAIRNIFQHPLKFLFNVNANVLRMLLDFPYDFKLETWKTSWVVVPNMFLLTMFFASLYPAWLARRVIPLQIWAILALASIAFAGSSLLSAESRMFTVLVPL